MGGYRDTVYHALPPACITLDRIMSDREELYRAVPPSVENIPTSVLPSYIDDSIPTEEEVEWVVQILQGHRLGGPSLMCSEHLRSCCGITEHQKWRQR